MMLPTINNDSLSPSGLASHLQATLVQRCGTNPSYSLRAFAKQLGLESSFLSKLLSGQRSITFQLIERLTEPLLLSPVEVREFKDHLARSKGTQSAGTKYVDLSLDAFKVIADWHHYAILELTKVEGFHFLPSHIGKKLGISMHEARDAVERLKRLEMLEIDQKTKKLRPAKNFATYGNLFTAPAFRKLQKQVLLQAISALEDTPFEKRHQSSLTLAIHSPSLKKAIARIQDFRDELGDVLQPEGKKYDDVYQFSISLFPVEDHRKGTLNDKK